MKQSFLFGGDTGLTYEDLKKRQAVATKMQERGALSRPRTAVEGLNSAANSILGALMTKKLGQEETRQREEYGSGLQEIFSGQQPQNASYMPFLPEGEAGRGANVEPSGMFGSLEAQYGLPSGYLARTAQIESGGDPNAKNPNSSATGAFQFIDSTAAQYGLTDPTDLNASADAAARLARDNAAVLERALGRKPNSAELYLAHQQGAGGAAKLLANQNARAVDIVGADAVRLNGGNADMTAGQFAGLWLGKFAGQGGVSAPAGPDPRIVELMSSPYATPGQRSALGMLLQHQLQQQAQANDPRRQMQIERERLELEQLRNPQMTPYQQAQLDLAQQKLEAAPKPTADQQNYQFYSDQETEAGRVPLSFNEWDLQSKKAGAMTINNSVGGADLTTSNRTQQQKVNIAAASLDNAFQRYSDLIQEHGAELAPGKARDAILAERRNIQLQMKELFNLGVLNGPDLELMNQMMLDPTDFLTVAGGAIGSLFGGDGIKERSLANVQQLRGMFNDMQKSWQTGGLPAAESPADPPKENPYLNMTQEEFNNLDISKLTPEQIDQLFEARQ